MVALVTSNLDYFFMAVVYVATQYGSNSNYFLCVDGVDGLYGG